MSGRSDSGADALASTISPTVASVADAPRETAGSLAPGTLVDGTYRIARRIGAGGMGVVYLARDEKLERDVALKLHIGSAGERLAREAKAIAQLVHPNVVTVFEIGSRADHPFVAMEYVDGGTARTWLAERARSPREIIAFYAAAARGLAAAHRAGIVHRDFKPDNVLVGRDGRIRVADFGLARDAAIPREEEPPGATEDSVLTVAGSVIGTPAYMAPEQHAGRHVGAAADQFALCVALWEALHGERPFRGVTLAELAAAIREKPRPPRAGWVGGRRARRVLERGLSVDPAARFPSIDALADALTRDRRRVLARAGGAVAMATVGVVVGVALNREARPSCQAAGDLGSVWSDARRAELRASFVATGREGAAQAFDRVEPRISDYAKAWTAQRVEVCEALERRDQSDALHDMRVSCLDRRRGRLEAMLTSFAEATPATVDGAFRATSDLEGLERCADVPALTAAYPPPTNAAARAAVEAVDRELDRVEALDYAGHFDEGKRIAIAALANARATEHPPVIARATRLIGICELALGDVAGRKRLEDAARLAGEARDDLSAAKIWFALIDAYREADVPRALQLLPVVETSIARAGNLPVLEIRLMATKGALAHAEGKFAQAKRELAGALARAETTREARDQLPIILTRLSQTERMLKEPDAARRHIERALALLEQTVGPSHPHVAATLTNIGNVHRDSGRFAEAREAYVRSLAIKEATLGPDRIELLSPLAQLSGLDLARGEHARARPSLERALRLARRTYGESDVRTATHAESIARLYVEADLRPEAKAAFVQLVPLMEDIYGKSSPIALSARLLRARTLYRRGELAPARAEAERVRRLLVEQNETHPLNLLTEALLVHIRLELGEPAAPLLELTRRAAEAVDKLVVSPELTRRVHLHHAISALAVGQFELAEREAAVARPRLAAFTGERHPDVAACDEVSGAAAFATRRYDVAERRFAAAIDALAGSADGLGLVRPLSGHALALAALGRSSEALEVARRARAIAERTTGARDIESALVTFALTRAATPGAAPPAVLAATGEPFAKTLARAP